MYIYKNTTSITKQEFLKLYNHGLDPTLEKYYQGLSVRNVLAYSEKLRWNAYYIFNGYSQMPKDEIKVLARKNKPGFEVHRKDPILKTHACLTSHRGLEELTNYILSHESNIDDVTKELKITEADYYMYDYMHFDNPDNSLFDTLLDLGYKIIKL